MSEQRSISIHTISLANLEVVQTNLTPLLGYVKYDKKSQVLKVCIIDQLISFTKNLFTEIAL